MQVTSFASVDTTGDGNAGTVHHTPYTHTLIHSYTADAVGVDTTPHPHTPSPLSSHSITHPPPPPLNSHSTPPPPPLPPPLTAAADAVGVDTTGDGQVLHCTHTALILHSYGTHTLLILYSYSTHTLLILYSYSTVLLLYCTHTVLILYSYCTHTPYTHTLYTIHHTLHTRLAMGRWTRS
jgi:hypothetical protein